MNYKEIILSIAEGNYYSKKKLSNGTLLFTQELNCNDPKYTYNIFHGLNEKNIEDLEKDLKNLPEVYKEFLAQLNGLYLFNGNFYLYGKAFLEKGMSWEEQVYQPYDLIEENEDPPMKIDENLFYFGGTPHSIFVFEKNGSILELARKSKKKIGKFSDFDAFLLTKLEQYSSSKE